MADLKMSIPHALSQDEATSRIKKLIEKLRVDHSEMISNVNEKWEGHTGTFSFTAIVFDVSGSITVEATEIKINGQVPFAEKKIEEIIRTKADELLV